MKITLKYKNKKVSNYQELIKSYSNAEFDSPYRSTIPLLHYWKDTETQLVELTDILNTETPHDATLDFEHCVYSLKGNGRPSQTDLMISFNDCAIAIEAKYTEPEYETVDNWLDDSENKHLVLQGWIDLINKTIPSEEIEVKDVLRLPYQLVHRCASACAAEKSKTFLIYQCFDLNQSKFEYYQSQLNALKQLTADAVAIFLINIPLIKQPQLKILQSRWDSNERKMHLDILEMIHNANFVNFGTIEKHRI